MQAKCPEYIIKTPSNYNMKILNYIDGIRLLTNRMLFILAVHIIQLNFLKLETNLDMKTIIF